jgi:co-chaperonin GroES (HSP10)
MTPLNKMILVSTIQEKQEKPQQSFILPDDVVTKRKPHELVRVTKIAEDSKFRDGTVNVGDLIMVESHMLTEVIYNDEKYFLISENGILAKC